MLIPSKMKKIKAKAAALLLFFSVLSGCVNLPDGIEPVSGFDLKRYAGQWYEIARLDHKFERGLEKVSTIYTVNDNGTVRVVNRGFLSKDQKWKEATGKAKFVGEADVGYLKVSFFGPFYGPYVIFELDKEDYQYAFVTSGDDYLWLLSRTPEITPQLKQKFLDDISVMGYPSDQLIFVNHQ